MVRRTEASKSTPSIKGATPTVSNRCPGKEPDVLHTGDTFWNGIYPFIDYSTGGSIDGSIRAADSNLELATGQTIIIPAHTDSDISVYFKEPDVLHTGDTFWNGIYPFIDYSTGGSIDGSIRAADSNLELATGQTIIIPGHGQPVSNRSELRDFRDMLVGVRSNVAALKENGHSLEAIVSAKPTAAYDAKWGNSVISPALFTKLVFEGT